MKLKAASLDKHLLPQVDGLRKEVEQLLLRKIEDPGLVLGQNRVVEAMLRLLSHDGF